jgi:hypothetical protein
MILKFWYKCRICAQSFQDPGVPEMEAANIQEAEMILTDSLRQNPVARKRVAINQSHLCGKDENNVLTVGVGDLVGYRLFEFGGIYTGTSQ